MNISSYELPGGVRSRLLEVNNRRVLILSEAEAENIPQLKGSTTDYMKFLGQVGSFSVYTQVGNNILSVTTHAPKKISQSVPYTEFARRLDLNFLEGLELERALLRE